MHYETVFKPLPDGTHNFDDAMDLVDQLRSNDAYARSIADNGLAFARTHLIKVILVQGQDETSQLLTHLNDELKADVVRNLLIWQCLEQGVRQSTGTASHICLHAFNHSRLRLCTCNTQEVALVYLQQLLVAYKDLFQDMDEYMSTVGDTNSSTVFKKHTLAWQTDWRTLLQSQPQIPSS